RDRRRGYEEALADAGLPLEPELVAEATAAPARGLRRTRALLAPAPRGALAGRRELLALEGRAPAVFTVNNLVALGAIEAVRATGREVPDDVALGCFDDIEYASRLNAFPHLREQPAETFGSLGTQLLLERIDDRTAERQRTVVLPAQFVVRRSGGAAPWRCRAGSRAVARRGSAPLARDRTTFRRRSRSRRRRRP